MVVYPTFFSLPVFPLRRRSPWQRWWKCSPKADGEWVGLCCRRDRLWVPWGCAAQISLHKKTAVSWQPPGSQFQIHCRSRTSSKAALPQWLNLTRVLTRTIPDWLVLIGRQTFFCVGSSYPNPLPSLTSFTDIRSTSWSEGSPASSSLHSPSELFLLDKFLTNLILSWLPFLWFSKQIHHLEEQNDFSSSIKIGFVHKVLAF